MVTNIADYPRTVVFWCWGNPESLIERIHNSGFAACGITDNTLVGRGFPARWQAIIAIVVLWNVLLGLDMHRSDGPAQLGMLSLRALMLLFAGSVRIWHAGFLRRIIMKPDRKPQEIKAWLYLLAFISGLLLVVFIAGSVLGTG